MDFSRIFLNADVCNGFKFGFSLCFAVLILDVSITILLDLWRDYFKKKKQDL